MFLIEIVDAVSTDHAVAITGWDNDGGAATNSPSDIKSARDGRRRPSSEFAGTAHPEEIDETPPLHGRTVNRIAAERPPLAS